MVPLTVVVRHEVRNRAPKVALTQRDHAVETWVEQYLATQFTCPED